MNRLVALAFAAATFMGCATVDVYHYEPRALPSGSQALAVVNWSLADLRNVTWAYGEPDPDPTRKARLAATPTGVAGAANVAIVAGSPLDISYAEIAAGVRMVTQMSGNWTVYIYDSHDRQVQLEFTSYAAARLFLDAATVLAHSPAVAPQSDDVEVASIKN
jgi:hypothetical protein